MTLVQRLRKTFRDRLLVRAWQRWKDACEEKTCPECGFLRIGREWHRRVDGKLVHEVNWQCGCESRATDEQLLAWLRRLAGINPGHKNKEGQCEPTGMAPPANEWKDWNRGLAGGRACGPGCWDSAVKAIEEG